MATRTPRNYACVCPYCINTDQERKALGGWENYAPTLVLMMCTFALEKLNVQVTLTDTMPFYSLSNGDDNLIVE